MKRLFAMSFALALLSTSISGAQATAFATQSAEASRFDLAAGYHLVNANAPPGDCGCFTANGGFVGAQFNLSPWVGVAGEAGFVQASKISSLGQNLRLTTFMAGPRVSFSSRRLTPFGEFMVGGAHAGDSYFPSASTGQTSATSFSYAAGGGFDFHLNSRFAVRIFDASYLHTSFPNGGNDSQRQLQINSGVVVHFGGASGPSRYSAPAPVSIAPSRQPKDIALACYTNNHLVTSGKPVHISAETSVDPDRYYFTYEWSTTGGVIVGHGNVITINTDGLEPGTYTVAGHAVLDSSPSRALSCKVDFEVASEQQQQQLLTKISAPRGDNSFEVAAQKNLRDLFFNYDQADLRTDAASAVRDDAAYLVAHPSVNITIAGYADERGSAEYNVALGMERAEAARTALISGGVAASRIEVISYGKERPFCTDDNESCYQQNRRAQFVVENR